MKLNRQDIAAKKSTNNPKQDPLILPNKHSFTRRQLHTSHFKLLWEAHHMRCSRSILEATERLKRGIGSRTYGVVRQVSVAVVTVVTANNNARSQDRCRRDRQTRQGGPRSRPGKPV